MGFVLVLGTAAPARTQVVTYCCDAAAEANFVADLVSLSVATSTAKESFEQGDWVLTQIFAQPGSLTNLGVTWSPLISGGFGTSTGGGSVHDGSYLMYAVGDTLISHPVPDGYSLSTGTFTLHAVGGWFTGNGAQLEFTLDDDPLRVVDFTGSEASITSWKFLGFIEPDPAGFTKLSIHEADEVGDEVEIFFSDDFTLVAEEGAFLEGLIFFDGFESGTTDAWSN